MALGISIVETARLDRIEKGVRKANRKLNRLLSPKFDFVVGPVTNKRRKQNMLELNINDEQKVQVTLNPVTLGGHPVALDGPPIWSIISGDGTVQPAEDGLSAQLVSPDVPGDTDYLVKADADLGQGVVEVSDIIRLHVSGALAANLGLVAGEPTQK